MIEFLTMGVSQRELTAKTVKFYDKVQTVDRNLGLSGGSGIVDHHFGVGHFDTSSLESMSQAEISSAIRYLEENQACLLIDLMGVIKPGQKILDAGCGRGGTAFRLYEKIRCDIYGVTIAPYQARFARNVAQADFSSGKLNFWVMNYLNLGFPSGCFDHIFSNETTMYAVNLVELFGEFRRVLKPGGKYVLATWNTNPDFPDPSVYVDPINKHYGVVMHTDSEYKQALAANGFDIEQDLDLTEQVIPHWELRSRWNEASGVEPHFLVGHKCRAILYKMISAKLVK